MSVQIEWVGRRSYEVTAIVALPGAEPVRVRAKWHGRHAWRCDQCGRWPSPRCRHAEAVAVRLFKGD